MDLTKRLVVLAVVRQEGTDDAVVESLGCRQEALALHFEKDPRRLDSRFASGASITATDRGAPRELAMAY